MPYGNLQLCLQSNFHQHLHPLRRWVFFHRRSCDVGEHLPTVRRWDIFGRGSFLVHALRERNLLSGDISAKQFHLPGLQRWNGFEHTGGQIGRFLRDLWAGHMVRGRGCCVHAVRRGNVQQRHGWDKRVFMHLVRRGNVLERDRSEERIHLSSMLGGVCVLRAGRPKCDQLRPVRPGNVVRRWRVGVHGLQCGVFLLGVRSDQCVHVHFMSRRNLVGKRVSELHAMPRGHVVFSGRRNFSRDLHPMLPGIVFYRERSHVHGDMSAMPRGELQSNPRAQV